MLVGLAHKVGTPPTRSHARTWSSLPQSTGLNRAREARTQDWGLKIQLSPFPCKLVAAAQGAPVALWHIELSHAHPRWETPPQPTLPARDGGCCRASPSPRGCPLPGDVPAEARPPLARCSPAAGAHCPVPRCRVSHPGAPGSEEEIPGGRDRLRGSSLHVPSGQALPRCVGPNPAPPRGRAGARGRLSPAALGTPGSPSPVAAWVSLPRPHLHSLGPPGGDVAKAPGAKPHPS